MKAWIRLQCYLRKGIDLKSNGKYPANVLSNFWGNTFKVDGVLCKSMEGFLQSLKHQDTIKQQQICSMKGGRAKHQGTDVWKVNQQVYWRGKVIDRHSEEYQRLIRKSYHALFEQSENFRNALMLTRGKKLYHSIGSNNPYDTILTRDEFCTILTEIRDDAIARLNTEPEKKKVYVDMDSVLVDWQPGLWGNLKPVPGAIEAMRILEKHYDVYVISTIPWENPLSGADKLLWLRKYLGDVCYERLIFSHHKELSKGDYLIDGGGKNGADQFEGEWIQFGSERFPGWENVLEYLVQEEKS